MSQNEVQANSVIIPRDDYLEMLYDARNAYVKLTNWRQAQIDEWLNDTVAREADLNRMLEHRFTRRYKYQFDDYNESLDAPSRRTWLEIIMLRKPKPKRVFNSIIEFTEAARGQTFEQFKREFMQDNHGRAVIPDAFYWLATNTRAFVFNEWKTHLDAIEADISLVEYGARTEQFVIPRDEYNEYRNAMVLASQNELPPADGELRAAY